VAGMRLWLGVGVVVALLTAGGLITASGSRAAGTCSVAEAETLAAKFDMGDARGRVGVVLCGPFTGPQSNAMAFSFHWYGCIPVAGWAVFRFTGSDWQLVLRRDRERAVLAAAGSDIQATVDVVRTGDSLCISTGGRRSQLWHWDGTRLVAGPWTQVEPPVPLKDAFFDSPSAVAVRCWMNDGPGRAFLLCQSFKGHPLYQQKATIRADGAVSICRVHGNSNRCHILCSCDEGPTPKLAYGKEMVVGRFRCQSLRTGMRCTLIRSGKGFLINKTRATKIG
jgi:hypothetical protein